jgi:hypothetical protein
MNTGSEDPRGWKDKDKDKDKDRDKDRDRDRTGYDKISQGFVKTLLCVWTFELETKGGC